MPKAPKKNFSWVILELAARKWCTVPHPPRGGGPSRGDRPPGVGGGLGKGGGVQRVLFEFRPALPFCPQKRTLTHCGASPLTCFPAKGVALLRTWTNLHPPPLLPRPPSARPRRHTPLPCQIGHAPLPCAPLPVHPALVHRASTPCTQPPPVDKGQNHPFPCAAGALSRNMGNMEKMGENGGNPHVKAPTMLPPSLSFPPPCPSPGGGVGGRHLLNPKIFVAAHCVVVAKPPPKSAAQRIPVESGEHVPEFKVKWSRTKKIYTELVKE